MTGPYRLYGPVVTCKVRGLPVPQGAIRSLGKGRPSVHANAATLKPWREQVQHAVEDRLRYLQEWPLDGPVAVHATFTMPKPRSAPKRRRTWPITRPDVDKLLRAVLDALQASGAIRDDSQVVEATTRKAYPGEHADALHVPGLALSLYEVGDDHSASEVAS